MIMAVVWFMYPTAHPTLDELVFYSFYFLIFLFRFMAEGHEEKASIIFW